MSASAKGLSTNGLIMPQDFPVAEYSLCTKELSPARAQFPKFMSSSAGRGMLWRTAFSLLQSTVPLCPSRWPQAPARHRSKGPNKNAICSDFLVTASRYSNPPFTDYLPSALLSPTAFPISTPRDQQRISPSSTLDALTKAFAGDPIIGVTSTILSELRLSRMA